MSSPKKVEVPAYMRFLFSSLSGVGASCVTHPLDVIKARLQVSGEGGAKKEHKNLLALMGSIHKQQGISGFYKGLTASMLRQATYTGVRFGVYGVAIDYFSQNGKTASLMEKIVAGIMGGSFGAVAGVPADVALTRMALDGRLPPDKRRNYKNVFNALGRIAREEGILTWFSGLFPTVIRACIVTVAQGVSYFQTKEIVLNHKLMKDGIGLHLFCSVVGALVSTTSSLPADIAKTRIQNMKTINGVPEYKGLLDCWVKMFKKEGIPSFFKGFVPMFLRNGPQNVVFFILLENLTAFYINTH